MRIRKNAKISPLLFTCSSSLLQNDSLLSLQTFQTHICQLNQSPWDVIPFPSNHQFQNEYTFKNGDSFAALDESTVATMMETEEDDNNKPAIDNFSTIVIHDNQQRDKKKVVKSGSDKALKRNSSCKGMNNGDIAGSQRRPRGRPKKKAAEGSSSNNSEFYYYSGFGPLWGKRRAGKIEADQDNQNNSDVVTLGTSSDDKVNDNVDVVVDVNANVVPCCSEIMDNEGLDYVEDDYEDDYCDDDDDNDNGKRRMRKPVKERSLKSLCQL